MTTITRANLPAIRYDPDQNLKKVIFLRVSPEVHAALAEQAAKHDTSLNMLCLSRLLARIDNCTVLPELRGVGRWKGYDKKSKTRARNRYATGK